MAARLTSGLSRLRELLEQARQTSVQSRPSLELVDVGDAVRATVSELQGRLTAVQVVFHGSVTAGRQVVPLYGGTAVLRRIVANLLTNAVEGNGVQQASRVDVEICCDQEPGNLTLRVTDDGPGFSATLLDYPIRAFHSTKSGGTGLGLYTVSQLVAASGGSLRFANRSTGSGAVVEVLLKQELTHAGTVH